MRFLLLLVPATAFADGWTDVPAMVKSATAPVDAELRTCGKLSKRIAILAARAKDGHTTVGMPVPGIGYRGYTQQERCLGTAIAKVKLPALPAEIDSVMLGYTVSDAPAVADQAFDDWRDPAATIANVIDDTRRATLAACDRKPRTVRVVLDLRHGKTRVWLPAWQFHSRGVRACLTKAIRDVRAPVLPRDMPELHLALAVAP